MDHRRSPHSRPRALVLVLGVVALGCSPRAYPRVRDQHCVEAALQRSPNLATIPAAKARFARTCREGDPAGCSSLGLLYQEGLGVDRDLGRAASLFRSACTEGNAAACTNLAVAVRHGRGVPANPARARRLAKRGCLRGHDAGCTEWGDLLYQRGERRRGKLRLQRTCEDGEAEACFRLAEVMSGEASSGQARAYYQRSCVGGHEAGCDAMLGRRRAARVVNR